MSAKPEEQIDERTRHNRLTIGHLLLWMATTGAVYANLRMQKPPPVETISFGASFLYQIPAGADSEEARTKAYRDAQQRVWRQMNARHVVMLVFAPVSGLALAGGVLAVWRLITRRFGFPAEPGHWLLVTFAGLMIVAALRSYMSFVMSGNGPDLIATTAATCLSLFVALFSRTAVHWRIAFGLLATGWAATALALILLQSPPAEASHLFGLGLLGISAFPLVAIACCLYDWASGERFDALHWIGVVVLIGFMAHFTALMVAGRL